MTEDMADFAHEILNDECYTAEHAHFLCEGPHSRNLDDVSTFFLMRNLVPVEGRVEGQAHGTGIKVPLIDINLWLSEQKKMMDPHVWAGIYMRVGYYIAHPELGRTDFHGQGEENKC